jgi:hypothetical protein
MELRALQETNSLYSGSENEIHRSRLHTMSVDTWLFSAEMAVYIDHIRYHSLRVYDVQHPQCSENRRKREKQSGLPPCRSFDNPCPPFYVLFSLRSAENRFFSVLPKRSRGSNRHETDEIQQSSVRKTAELSGYVQLSWEATYSFRLWGNSAYYKTRVNDCKKCIVQW